MTSRWILWSLLSMAVCACGDQASQTVGTVRPAFSAGTGGGSNEEDLIGEQVYGASSGVFDANGMYFSATQNKHRWGYYMDTACVRRSEVHSTNPNLTVDSTVTEQHCGRPGPYEVVITGNGHRWERSIAMLDSDGVLWDVPNNDVYADVAVPLDVGTYATNRQGHLRRTTTYAAATDTAAFGTGDMSGIATGTPVWFIATYQSFVNGVKKYRNTDDLNSYNFDVGRGGTWQPAVNSESGDPTDVDRLLPFRHVFRSPGGSTVYLVTDRVVEPQDSSMSDGHPTADTIQVTVTADPACWTSPGGPAGTSVSFSAACSDQRNAGIAQYRWVWSPGVSSSWSTNTSAYHVYPDSGSKSVTLLIKLSTNEGDTASATHTVSITAPQFTVSITPPVTPVHDTVTVKPNQTCLLRASTSGYNGTYSYTWEKKTKFAWSSIGSGARLDLSVGGTAKYAVRVNATLSGTTITHSDTLGFNVTSSGAWCP